MVDTNKDDTVSALERLTYEMTHVTVETGTLIDTMA